MIFNRKIGIASLILALLFSFSAFAQLNIPDKPKKEISVYDGADFLKDDETKQLRQKLETYADTTSTQIVIATINSLNGEYIGTYAAEWAEKWGIGQKDKDNGLLILVAKADSKIWFTTGYGIEDRLTDATSKTIIENIILPEFRKANYYEGLDKGTDAVFEVLAGKFDADQIQKQKEEFPWAFFIFPFIIVVVIIIIATRRKNKGGGPGSGHRNSSPDLLDILILGSMGRSMGGGSFGGSSSGGFGGGGGFSGGFGGGSFGGGGAGGSW
ncbi:TPM domain-containing protein [Psychroflexus aestuariivivens]|uniref:TPM domain-containing protein n=1 Tax=Psychroflexus aestuariivivens TaxID=1795040 RepID=UPI000FD9FB5D|nr:TPM domain-containing protein [Psychroflexus aestuariivivens]